MSALKRALMASLAGRASLAFVSGEIGIGKSTLVRQVASDAHGEGVRVITGLCYDMETSAPYSPWIDLARLYRPVDDEPLIPVEMEHMLDGSAPTPPAVAGIFEQFLLDVARQRGLLLILEDLQWADHSSLELLRILARRLSASPVAIVATYRDTDLHPRGALYRLLPTVIRETRAARINLLRFDHSTLEHLMHERYDLPANDLQRLVRYVERYAEGNPFFSEELLHALESDRILVEDAKAGSWKVENLDTFQMPLLLRQIIDGRLARLNDETRGALQIAAVIGDEISVPVWQQLTGLDIDALSHVVDDAMTSGVIEEAAGRQQLRFRHTLVREALYDSLVLLRRRVVHNAIGDILVDDPTPNPDTISHHYFNGGNPEAAAWLVRAARRAMQAASYLAAAARFEEALAILQNQPERVLDHTWLLLEISEAYRYVDTPRALSYLDIALERGWETHDQALVTAATWLRGRARALAGENALSEIDDALEMYEALDSGQLERIRKSSLGSVISHGALAPILALFGSHARAIDAAERYFSLLRTGQLARDPNEVGDAHFALAYSRAAFGEIDKARAEYQRARRRRAETGHYHGVAAAYDWEYVTLDKAYFGDNAAAGREMIRLADEAWLQSDFVQLLDADVVPHITEGHILLGEWDEARRRANACLSISVLRSGSTLMLAELDRLQGNQESARTRIRAAIPYGPEIEPSVWLAHNTMQMMRVASELALDREDLERARAWIGAYGRWATWTGGLPGRAVHPLLEAQAAHISGDIARAIARAQAALEFAAAPRQPLPLMTAHRLLGEFATEQGRIDEAVRHLGEALEIALEAEAPYEQARCSLAFARLELARGNRDAADAFAADALATAERLKAQPLIEKIARLVDAEAKAVEQAEAPAGLTPREIDVLKLVARGMTDAEVAGELHISPRTVGRHLSSIYVKLDVNSRTGATAFAYEHGLATG